MADALIDLTYIAKGTALFAGITSAQWALIFDVVHSRNMMKMRAPSASHSKRGSALDIIKPANWSPPEPEIKKILGV
jgi:predicted HAD superfamily Cof-like phosphohydrolase